MNGSSNWTGRTPRTLQQAFGAYTSTTLVERAEDMARHRRLAQIVALACALVVVMVIVRLA